MKMYVHQRCSVRVRRRPDGGPLREAFAPGGPSAPLVFHLGNTRYARADRVFALSPDRFTLAAGRDGSSRGCAHPKRIFTEGFALVEAWNLEGGPERVSFCAPYPLGSARCRAILRRRGRCDGHFFLHHILVVVGFLKCVRGDHERGTLLHDHAHCFTPRLIPPERH